jgi:hypothetical protein
MLGRAGRLAMRTARFTIVNAAADHAIDKTQ